VFDVDLSKVNVLPSIQKPKVKIESSIEIPKIDSKLKKNKFLSSSSSSSEEKEKKKKKA
jgi:hypothetical protein